MVRARLLVIQWDTKYWESLTEHLCADVCCTSPLFKGVKLAHDWQPHVIVIGRRIAKNENGIDAVAELRRLSTNPYVIVAAKRYLEPDAVKAVSLGADGYFDESDASLLAVVRAAVRHVAKHSPPPLRLLDGGLTRRPRRVRQRQRERPGAA